MKVMLRAGRRSGVAGLIIAALIFAMLFTAGIGYLLFQAQADQSSYQANYQAAAGRQQQSQEQLAFCARLAGTSCLASASTGTLTAIVNDTGGIPLSVVSWFVKDVTGKVVSKGVVGLASPLNLDVGGTGTITLSGYSYTCTTSCPLVFVSLLTSRGNVFTTQYPLSATITSTTITSSTATTVTGPGNGGGNSLVVVMSATPVQVFSGNVITDNVTLYNYANVMVTNAVLQPNPPSSTTTGTANLVPTGCSGPYTPPGKVSDPSGTIAGYSGSGVAPHIFYLCTYTARTGAVGGLASFSGGASGMQGSNNIFSATVTSNLVQIGGLTNAIAQGAFTSNFWFFKYSSCTNAPSGGGYSPKCNTNVAMPPSNVNILPEGAVISAGSNYYVAFYIQITNNFNTSLPLLQNTFEQFDQSAGGESDWWLVGTNTTMASGVYYPNYNPGGTGVPTLVSYPTDCNVVNSKNVPTDSNCIYVNPGQTVTITLASCGPGKPNWDWGGNRYGNRFDSGVSGCTSATPSFGSGGSATAGTTVISFEYKGASLTEDLAFQGIAFTS
jgi:hypothetical protein